MKPRGRKSAAALLVGPIKIDRLEPPYTLTDAEVVIWRMITAAMPSDHFAPSHIPLLTQLCRHVVASDRVSMLIEAICKARKLSTTELQSLLATQSAESSAIVRIMRSLRLTPQSLYRAETAKLRPLLTSPRPPWHRSPDDASYD